MRISKAAIGLIAVLFSTPVMAQSILNEDGTFTLLPQAAALQSALSSSSVTTEDLATLLELMTNATLDEPALRAQVEIAFTRAFLKYGRHITSGVLVPSEVNWEIQHKPNVFTPSEVQNCQGARSCSDPQRPDDASGL